MKTAFLSLAMLAVAALQAGAETPEITDASAEKSGMGWRVSATVRHPDSGWDHYADAWRVEDAAGQVLATRELLHPHVDEQPFTRSLSSVMFPDGARKLFLRAHCSVHGWADTPFVLEITR